MAKVKPSATHVAIDFGTDLVKIPKNEFIPDFPLSKIKPRTDNSRFYSDIERAGLEDSIRRFGFTEPLVLNSDHVVVHGELRLQLARDVFALSTVPVTILSEKASEQGAGYSLLANRLNEWATWNHAVTDILLLQENKIPAPKREKRKNSHGEETRQRVGIDWEADEALGSGKMSLRTALRKLGWFTNDVPDSLTADSFTLEKVAEEIVSRERSQIYQFNPEQLLFVARTRRALLRYFENPANVSLKEREIPKDKDPKVAEEKLAEKLAEKADYYVAIAKDIREYDFDLNPDGNKLERREEIVEAIMDVLVATTEKVDPALRGLQKKEIAELIKQNKIAVSAREFQKGMKSAGIFKLIEDISGSEEEQD